MNLISLFLLVAAGTPRYFLRDLHPSSDRDTAHVIYITVKHSYIEDTALRHPSELRASSTWHTWSREPA
jgi:hypothetical protein